MFKMALFKANTKTKVHVVVFVCIDSYPLSMDHDEMQRGLSGSTSKECGVDRPAFLT